MKKKSVKVMQAGRSEGILDGFVRSIPNVTLYPNPTTGTLQVISSEPLTGIIISDMSGREFVPII